MPAVSLPAFQSRLPDSSALGEILTPSKPLHPCQKNGKKTTEIPGRPTGDNVCEVLHVVPGI